MKRKVLSMLLVGAMAASMLAGCGSSSSGQTDAPADDTADDADAAEPETDESDDTAGEAPADDGEKITLKWAIWDQDTTPYWQALKDEYEKKNPNVTIEMVDLGSTDYMTVLATELSGSGTDFDLVTIKDVPGYATLVQKNTLEPLNSYIESAGIDLSQYGGTTDQVTANCTSCRSVTISGSYSTTRICLTRQALTIRRTT